MCCWRHCTLTPPAQIAVGGTQNLCWLLNGFFIVGSRIPVGWRWLFHILPYNHALDPLAMAVFHNSTATVSGVPVEEFLEDTYDNDWAGRWREVGILTVYVVFWAVLFFVGMSTVRHLK